MSSLRAFINQLVLLMLLQYILRIFAYSALLLIALLNVACSTTSNIKSVGKLNTDVAQDGSKRFTYSLEFKDIPAIPVADANYSRSQAGEIVSKQNFFDLHYEEIKDLSHLQLKKDLDSSGFCKQGFFLLEERIRLTNTFLRGECKEGNNDNKPS